MRTLIWSEDARVEFRNAIAFIIQDSPSAARAVRHHINDAALLLRDTPIGRAGRVMGTYEKPVLRTPYIIAYALSDHAVTILHVIHTSREWLEGEWPEDH